MSDSLRTSVHHQQMHPLRRHGSAVCICRGYTSSVTWGPYLGRNAVSSSSRCHSVWVRPFGSHVVLVLAHSWSCWDAPKVGGAAWSAHAQFNLPMPHRRLKTRPEVHIHKILFIKKWQKSCVECFVCSDKAKFEVLVVSDELPICWRGASCLSAYNSITACTTNNYINEHSESRAFRIYRLEQN